MVQRQDVVIIGAGLSGGLLAWTLKQRRPELKITLLDSRSKKTLAKTWSFHQTDIKGSEDIIMPLISKAWGGYDVSFAKYKRSFNSSYLTVLPEDLQNRIEESLGHQYIAGITVRQICENAVELQDGAQFAAECIVDARGPQTENIKCGYQKFLGLQVKLATNHGLEKPLLMDANIAQIDGYRFIYILPWSAHELLIEDTRYSDTSDVNQGQFIQEIENYCAFKGWEIETIIKKEVGALPIPFSDRSDTLDDKIPSIGVRGGFFHPVTGYSFPQAIEVAERIAKMPKLTTKLLADELNSYKAETFFDQKYFLLLNRMMFQAAEPSERFKIFERFYTLPEPLIQRFYRGRLTWKDRIHILSGRPPVPIMKALQSSWGRLR